MDLIACPASVIRAGAQPVLLFSRLRQVSGLKLFQIILIGILWQETDHDPGYDVSN